MVMGGLGRWAARAEGESISYDLPLSSPSPLSPSTGWTAWASPGAVTLKSEQLPDSPVNPLGAQVSGS